MHKATFTRYRTNFPPVKIFHRTFCSHGAVQHFRSADTEMTDQDEFYLLPDSGFTNGKTTSLLYAKWRRGKERPTMVAINRVKTQRLKAFQTQLISLSRVY